MVFLVVRRAAARPSLRWLSSKSDSPTSTSYEKMESDPRYQSDIDMSTDPNFGGDKFSIKGLALDGVRPAYLDMQATTPMDPRVLDNMLPHMMGAYGNPHSRTHQVRAPAFVLMESRVNSSSFSFLVPPSLTFLTLAIGALALPFNDRSTGGTPRLLLRWPAVRFLTSLDAPRRRSFSLLGPQSQTTWLSRASLASTKGKKSTLLLLRLSTSASSIAAGTWRAEALRSLTCRSRRGLVLSTWTI